MKENQQPPVQPMQKEQLQPDHLERFHKPGIMVELDVHGLPTTVPAHEANTVDL